MDPKSSDSKPSVEEEDLPVRDAGARGGDEESAAADDPASEGAEASPTRDRPRSGLAKPSPSESPAPAGKSGPGSAQRPADRTKTPGPGARPARGAGPSGASKGEASTPKLPPKGTTPAKKAATGEPGEGAARTAPAKGPPSPAKGKPASRDAPKEAGKPPAKKEGAKPPGKEAAKDPPKGGKALRRPEPSPLPADLESSVGETEEASTPSTESPGLTDGTRYFEDATELFVRTLQGTEGEEVIGWAHDRIDPDTMGAHGLAWFILREVFGKRYVCYYSKRMSFLMNRSLATNFMPSGVLRRCERTENLSEIVLNAPLLIVLDATCPEVMTDFSRLLRRNREVRQKPVLFFDHHRKGESDIDDLPHAKGFRNEKAQSTSAIMVHIARNLGLDLRGTEEGFRLAVVARAGIDTDLIGVDPAGYSDSTVAALDYLDDVLGDRGHEILEKLRAIKHPLSWYRKLGEALSEVENYDPTVAVVGLGVIDDTGIVPFVANRLLEVGGFKTTIVFGLVYDRIEGQIISVDLDASGRSNQDTEVVLPDLFQEIFFVTSPDGRKTSKGGGRANMLMGDYSGAGASVPLDYWRQLGTKSADEKIHILYNLAWPAEFLRLRHLLTSRVHSLKTEEVRSVMPIPSLTGL